MSRWSVVFNSWSKGPSQTEKDKCGNAETAVRKALAASDELAELDYSVFVQGSYKANTNVRLDSDVDICVRLNSTFFTHYPDGKTNEDFGNSKASLTYKEYKNRIGRALDDYFDSSTVTRGNKAFDIHANTYRVDADVVPTFEYRYYTGRKFSDGNHHYHSGVKFISDSGSEIINWPDQAVNNGVTKNNNTGRRYKRVIRVLKRLRNHMQENGVRSANNIPSFLIECLVWNTPDTCFQKIDLYDDVREVIVAAYDGTKDDEHCKDWCEVNDFNVLFHTVKPWSRKQANKFLVDCWNHVGFE